MSDLTCPKCQEAMRTYERSGVNVDQCTGCRGIFLDRGELDVLLTAEARSAVPASGPTGTPGGYPTAPAGLLGSLFGDKHGSPRRGHH